MEAVKDKFVKTGVAIGDFEALFVEGNRLTIYDRHGHLVCKVEVVDILPKIKAVKLKVVEAGAKEIPPLKFVVESKRRKC